MPERSPSRESRGVSQAPGSDYFPESDFLESGDLGTHIEQMADGRVAELDVLHTLDPDQVSGVVKKRLGLTFWIATSWLVFISGLAIFAAWLPLKDPNFQDYNALKQGPTGTYWLGTDDLGRDQLSRIIHGAQVSLTVGVTAIVLGLIVGGTVGLLSGFFKGKLETLLMGAMDVLLAFPALLLALAIITFTESRHFLWFTLGHSLLTIAIAIGIVSIAPIARLVRASTLVFTEREFVLASRTLGAGNWRIIRKEILPNVMLPVLSFALIGVAVAIVAEGGLAFLGLSVAPPQATWGQMIYEGKSFLGTNPMIALVPCFVLFLTVLSLNLAGDRVREYFDVKEGGL